MRLSFKATVTCVNSENTLKRAMGRACYSCQAVSTVEWPMMAAAAENIQICAFPNANFEGCVTCIYASGSVTIEGDPTSMGNRESR